jgi:D-3-phosphoglycerate dehydrogenase
MKILVSDPIADEGIGILKEIESADVVVKTGMSEEELIEEVRDASVLIVRSATKVTKEVIEAAKDLKMIGRAGVGVDNVDIVSATKRGIIVMNTPDSNTISTAEHTMAMILAASRKIPQAYLSMKQGKWERKRFTGQELFSKVLGIVGLGRIGRQVALRAQAFGMKTIGYDPFVSPDFVSKFKIECVGFDELLSTSDYITVHTPLSSETKHLIGEREIEKMKSGVIIINCARGGIIDESALYSGLSSGRIKACALDVFEKEPPEGSPLLNIENCIFVPHLGASTEEAQRNVGIEIANQIKDALLNNRVRNAVNIPQIDPDSMKILSPYIDLAERLGSFAIQLVGRKPDAIQIEYAGEIIEYETSILSVSLLKALLSFLAKDESINYVNAEYIAKEMGIEVASAKTNRRIDYTNLITVTLVCGKDKRSLSGTVLASGPKMVEIDRFKIEVAPEGNLLVLSQTDEPGIIGKVGSLLGSSNINIGWLQLARTEKGGDAISLWNVDADISEGLLSEIESITQVRSAKVVNL